MTHHFKSCAKVSLPNGLWDKYRLTAIQEGIAVSLEVMQQGNAMQFDFQEVSCPCWAGEERREIRLLSGHN